VKTEMAVTNKLVKIKQFT